MNGDMQRPQSSTRDVQEQAVEWVVNRRVAETWGEQDQARLDAWLNEFPAHLLAYWRAEDGWNRTELLGALRSFRPAHAQGRLRAWALWTRRAAVAATVVIVGAAATAYLTRPVEQTYSTPVGGHEALTLADGSQVELNTDTVLRIGVAGKQRTAILEKGEAYFQIKHDSAHPFIVTAANHRIVDLGTKFSVRTDRDRIEVALVEGLARIDNPSAEGHGRSALLEPGDVAVATAQTISVTKKTQPQLTSELGWRRGVLVFDNTPLVDVAAQFNRYNQQKIVIADAAAARLTIVGTFPTNDLEAVLNTAREVFDLHVSQKGDEILISR